MKQDMLKTELFSGDFNLLREWNHCINIAYSEQNFCFVSKSTKLSLTVKWSIIEQLS